MEADLVIGHDGVFEVSINDSLVYTNNSECSVLPATNTILEEIHTRGGTPLKPLETAASEKLSLNGAACPLPVPGQQDKQSSIQQAITAIENNSEVDSKDKSCGCSCASC